MNEPPESYVTGTEYTKEEIDKALALEETEGRRLVPRPGISVDMVLQFLELQQKWESIRWSELWCCESELLVVKMEMHEKILFRTTELMEGSIILSDRQCRWGSRLLSISVLK